MKVFRILESCSFRRRVYEFDFASWGHIWGHM